MGRRGPRPAPTALKVLRGERRPSRVNYRAPKPLPNLPVKPADLPPQAGATWDLVIGELGHTGVLTALDGLVLRLLADARYASAATALAASGPLIRGARAGELIKNPLHQIVRDNATLVLMVARELGATPSARAGLRTPAAEPGARLAAFLGGTRGG